MERLEAVGANLVGAVLNRVVLGRRGESFLPYYHQDYSDYAPQEGASVLLPRAARTIARQGRALKVRGSCTRLRRSAIPTAPLGNTRPNASRRHNAGPAASPDRRACESESLGHLNPHSRLVSRTDS